MATRRRSSGRKQRWSQQTILYRGVLFAMAVALGKFLFPSSSGPCVADEAIASPFGIVQPCECFSETYLEARTKFRQAATDQGAQLFQLAIYKNYTTDIAYLPNQNSKDLVVHTSGVHGIEGYAGSAIQIALLKSLHVADKQRPSLLLIHAVNPYGMAHYRRFNENNVDLNRNGIHDFTEVLARDPNLAHYVDFDEQFNPKQPYRFGFIMELLPVLVKHGLVHLKQAMVTGQYHKPSGVFYGGEGLESSNANLYNFTKTFLQEIHHTLSSSSPASLTTWINVHTGLGPHGKDTILFGAAGLGGICNANREDVAKVFNTSLIPGATGGDDVQAGFSLMQGSTEQLVQPLFAGEDRNDWFVTQEFGTIPSILVGRAMILENRMHHHPTSNEDSSMGDSLLKNAFYPQTQKWRRAILTQGLRLVQQAMER
jgi:hypothetical protein